MSEPIIVCPICGQQYHPAEIFLPNYFLGKPTDIVKNTSGKIDFHFGQDMDPDETYICDNCGAHLKIHANISFNVAVDENKSEEHVTHFNRAKKTTLEETLFNTDDNN